MEALEFDSHVVNGAVLLPKNLKKRNLDKVRVILLFDEKEKDKGKKAKPKGGTTIWEALQKLPRIDLSQKPFTREEIYEGR